MHGQSQVRAMHADSCTRYSNRASCVIMFRTRVKTRPHLAQPKTGRDNTRFRLISRSCCKRGVYSFRAGTLIQAAVGLVCRDHLSREVTCPRGTATSMRWDGQGLVRMYRASGRGAREIERPEEKEDEVYKRVSKRRECDAVGENIMRTSQRIRPKHTRRRSSDGGLQYAHHRLATLIQNRTHCMRVK